MIRFQDFAESQLEQGRTAFSRSTALAEIQSTPEALQAAAARMRRRGRLISPRRGFYVLVRPEDRQRGPDPARWIDPLMKHLGLDYRISLLRAAAFHGSAHQAAMVFQVIAPRQLAPIVAGRQRIEFLYQAPGQFAQLNRPEWLDRLKTDAGFAQVAGVELTLLDMCRYFHRAGGINAAAQAVHDLGKRADPRILRQAAKFAENATVRRLGYLLERSGHARQSSALLPFAQTAKSFKDLDPAAKPIVAAVGGSTEKDPNWKLTINVELEIDT